MTQPISASNIYSTINHSNTQKSEFNTQIERIENDDKVEQKLQKNPAAQSIAQNFVAQSLNLTPVNQEANDGISLVQTANTTLDAISDNLEEVKKLTLSATKDSYDLDQLAEIQKRIDQHLNEIDRLAEKTLFNGKPVFNDETKIVQVDRQTQNNNVEIQTQKINSKALNVNNVNVRDLTVYTPVQGSALKGRAAYVRVSGNGTSSNPYRYVRVSTPKNDATQYYVNQAESVHVSMKKLDEALERVKAQQKAFDDAQNRIESIINDSEDKPVENTDVEINIDVEPIKDPSTAKEVVNESVSKIEQEPDTAVQAQANQIPQMLMALLS